MSAILQFFLHTEGGHLILIATFLLAVSSLEAPTKDSPMWYRYMFRFLNGAALQLKRMFPKIENSPNFPRQGQWVNGF